MAVLPGSSSNLELTISVPGFSSSSGDQNNNQGGGTMKDFDINKVPSSDGGSGEGDHEEYWNINNTTTTTVSMEDIIEEESCNINGGSSSSTPPRKKLRLSKEQSRLLEESFRQNHTLNPKQKEALATQLRLRPRQVEVWFQNRRARSKLKQTRWNAVLKEMVWFSMRQSEDSNRSGRA